MRVICSWCNKEMKEVEPLDKDTISHGICDDCYLDQMDKTTKLNEPFIGMGGGHGYGKCNKL